VKFDQFTVLAPALVRVTTARLMAYPTRDQKPCCSPLRRYLVSSCNTDAITKSLKKFCVTLSRVAAPRRFSRATWPTPYLGSVLVACDSPPVAALATMVSGVKVSSTKNCHFCLTVTAPVTSAGSCGVCALVRAGIDRTAAAIARSRKCLTFIGCVKPGPKCIYAHWRAANLGRSRLFRRPEPAESRLRAELPALHLVFITW
jgi:hypothetical protein